MAEGKVGLPSSRARSAGWPARLQPTVELDVPKSTPHAVEIMDNSGTDSTTAHKCTRCACPGPRKPYPPARAAGRASARAVNAKVSAATASPAAKPPA